MSETEADLDMDRWGDLYDQLSAKIISINAVTEATKTHLAVRLADVNMGSDRVQRLIAELNSTDPQEVESAAGICTDLGMTLKTLRYYISHANRYLEKLEEKLYVQEEAAGGSC